jgi:hypothetical protein
MALSSREFGIGFSCLGGRVCGCFSFVMFTNYEDVHLAGSFENTRGSERFDGRRALTLQERATCWMSVEATHAI